MTGRASGLFRITHRMVFSKEDPWGQALAGVISRKIGRVNKEKPKQ